MIPLAAEFTSYRFRTCGQVAGAGKGIGAEAKDEGPRARGWRVGGGAAVWQRWISSTTRKSQKLVRALDSFFRRPRMVTLENRDRFAGSPMACVGSWFGTRTGARLESHRLPVLDGQTGLRPGATRMIGPEQPRQDEMPPEDHDSARFRADDAAQEERFGQYSIDRKIGAGTMGVVFRAHHAMLSRPAVIKLIDPSKTNDKAIARFEREVQVTSQLNHPNTIAIYDYGRTAQGAFYYVMEYLDGITFDELIKTDGPQSEGRVIHVLQQVCGSLAEAHGVGLVHRDVKPENIMLNHRGGLYDFVKLLDFGLAKAVDRSEDMALTATGEFLGAPLFASPEAIERPSETDARSDLYSLGAVAYYALAEKPPFKSDNPFEVLMNVLEKAPPPPSQACGRPISSDLESLILSCLEKDPDNRPQSAHALLASLSSCDAAGTWGQDLAAEWWTPKGRDASE